MNLAQQIIQLLLVFGPMAPEVWEKFKAVLELGPDEKENLKKLVDASVTADQDTLDRIAQWRVEVGLDPAPPAKPTEGAD